MANLKVGNDNDKKKLSNQLKIGSMDSIETFSSCFTHPFNSLVDLNEEQFKEYKSNKNDLKLNQSFKNLDQSKNKNEEIAKRQKSMDRELPLISDINRSYRKEEFRFR